MNVAQHSYNLSHVVGPDLARQRAALIHDVPELFTGEVPRPIKSKCPGIQQADACCMRRLGEVFGVPDWAFDAIADADTAISNDERLFMFDHLEPDDREKCLQNQLGIVITPVTPDVAATSWTRRFYQLFKEDLS